MRNRRIRRTTCLGEKEKKRRHKVVSELYRLHEVGKKTDLDARRVVPNDGELVNNISARVEKSNMVQMWVPRLPEKADDDTPTVQDIGEEEDARLGVGEEVYRKHDGVFFQLRSDQRRRDC